jgi:replicative DNA helicase
LIIDKGCIQQVLGGIIKKPSILTETEKYNLTVQDFSSTFEKIIFTAINNLYNNGARSISIVDIENSLTTNDTAKKVFENNNGIEYLQDVDAFVDENNFDYYYNKLKKINLLRDFQRQGIDTRDFYIEI